MRRFVRFQLLPPLILLIWAIAPLALGWQTLYQRDIFHAHLPAKSAQAAALAKPEIPWIDPLRGGQPLLGNPNTLSLYPDSLLAWIAEPIWALNAHFWLHWLLAPFAFVWFARACSLTRPAAWAGGLTYATGGYFLSLMNLYNLLPAATLTPAFLAAWLDFRRCHRPWHAPALGLLWALLLLAGDPFSALLALVLGLSVDWVARRLTSDPLHRGHSWPLALALGMGTVCVSPLAVEFLRIVPESFRAATGDQTTAALAQSLPPVSVIEWFWPLFFGQYDFAFWGHLVYDQGSSLFLSLFPGILPLALVLVGARPRRQMWVRWAIFWVLLGVFFALGRHNPLVAALYELPFFPLLRFPIKIWLVVAIALALLVAVGFERWSLGGDRRLPRWLAFFALAYLSAFLVLLFRPDLFRAALDAADPRWLPGPTFAEERLRLMWSALKLTLAAGLLVAATTLRRRHGPLAAGALLLIHTWSQLDALGSLLESDDRRFYLEAPPLAASLPADALTVHGTADGSLFGATPLQPRLRFPDLRQLWVARCRHLELSHTTAARLGRRYDLVVSPEGLDSYHSVLVHHLFEEAPNDVIRVKVLASLGVEYLILDRPLDPGAAATHWAAIAGGCTENSAVYQIQGAAPAFQMAGHVATARSVRESFDLLAKGAEVVIPATSGLPPLARPNGQVLSVTESANRLVAEVDSPEGAIFVTRRAYLPLYRAWIDGHPAPPRVVNAFRLGLAIPPGRHHVVLEIDRRPTWLGFGGMLLGLSGLAIWWYRTRNGH